MYSVRDRQMKYGIFTGVLAFVAGWAITAYLTPASVFSGIERWQVTLWVFLGIHLVELSDIHTGGVGFTTHPIGEIAPTLPLDLLQGMTVVFVSLAAIYACHEISSTSRVKHCIHNSWSVGTGYFIAALAALIVSDIQPTITTILIIGLSVGAAIWIGSSFVGAVTRGVPFLGIASLSTIMMLGVLVLIGGITVLSALGGVFLVAYGSTTAVGVGVGFSRLLKEKGERLGVGSFTRLHALRVIFEDHVIIIVLSVMVFVGLVIGLRS